MHRGKDRLAVDLVTQCLERGVTGRVLVHIPTRGTCAIYVMEGEMIAAHSPRDGVAVVERILARDRIDGSVAQQMMDALGQGARIGSVVAGRISESLLVDLLAARFRQNLVDYLFNPSRARFEVLPSVRVEHLQVGHDSTTLIDELYDIHTRIDPWRQSQAGTWIHTGTQQPSGFQSAALVALCTSGSSLSDLVGRSPMFEADTLIRFIDLVTDGCLIVDARDASAPSSGSESMHAGIQAHVETELGSRLSERAERSNFDTSTRRSDTSLDAFIDHESHERGLGRGAFSADPASLDRVALSTSLPQSRSVGRPALRLSGRILGEADFLHKLEVCNEVLAVVAETVDAQGRVGDGCSLLQLVVDASPAAYVPLLRGVTIHRDGAVDEQMLKYNVGQRPPAQQRRLVNGGMTDLIQRVLARCLDELEGPVMDTMLAQIAGYQQRMGL